MKFEHCSMLNYICDWPGRARVNIHGLNIFIGREIWEYEPAFTIDGYLRAHFLTCFIRTFLSISLDKEYVNLL